MNAITVHGLKKSYKGREVLRGIDLSVSEGEIVGILGPNGAGKTTAVEMIGGLRTPDAGTMSVHGIDPASGDPGLRRVLGMQLQQAQLPDRITVEEALDLFASFYENPVPTDELLGRFGLEPHRGQFFEKLSGGQKQRLSVALALVGRPKVAILDELTTGLDAAARRDIWQYLEALSETGTTMLLVTHSMEEAQRLCDRIYLLNGGVIVAEGAPHEIAARSGGHTVSFEPDPAIDLDILRGIDGITSLTTEGEQVVVIGDADTPQDVLTVLIERGIRARRLRVTEPTLDDAYLRAMEN
ncbi:ABC transporter ATP-binding protein [Gulosibacter molinativorax]|uniref:ABC transporter ATP-binding protein n=1 Tax=Gulosibacter molinativorax TaxID=256821 RepID=A0ABT7C8W8_9MICO|nr:ABC transporter ATP-binding protein [Gulosibacter molinativorax]MDJ1371535.1 ABC transporter ATP-binding protein [Gulosibacter molinativorax]QUY62477.1 Putative ABC transporter ATP-binding protein [Gulosibacter molinativorax]